MALKVHVLNQVLTHLVLVEWRLIGSTIFLSVDMLGKVYNCSVARNYSAWLYFGHYTLQLVA